MGIYITSDANASGSITVGSQTIPFTVTPNNVTEKFIGNASCTTCSASSGSVYLTQTDGIAIGAAIHVTANNPVVVYAHIIHSSRSGATLVLPTPVWGKQYMVPSYKSIGTGLGEGHGAITIVAKDTNTTVQITPTARFFNSTRTQLTPYTITLANPGDVYEVQFEQDADISGTMVQSVSTGSGCKKIAVFSSTDWSAFGCTNASSGDNLYQQLFPTGAWGKSFLTAPAKTRTSDIVRVFVLDPTTVVTKTENGITTTLTGLVNNSFYEYTTGNPTYIQANKIASVVQYFTTESCQNNATIGDPEMVVINPVEQTINNITVFSAHQNWVPPGQSAITNCYLNIIIPTVAAPSFKINGNSPTGSFIPIPGTSYSYLQEDVTNITISNPVQNLKADSNFIAIAYGFGKVESYGYNAGTNVIDLTQGLLIQNPYNTTSSSATCTGTPFSFAVKYPYQPLSITWDFGNDPHLSPNTAIGPINNPVADSSFIDNNSGKTIYVYKLPGTHTYNATGAYTVTVTSNNPTSDGCSGDQQQSYTINVYEPPVANFGLVTSGCLSDSVHFTDSSNANGRTLTQWHWSFGDNTIDSVQNPVKKYTTAGNYTVQLIAINDIGCYADTTRPLAISATPVVKFGVSDTTCLSSILSFTDSTSIASGTILNWYWDYGDGKKDTLTAAANRLHAYTQTGTDSVTLKVVSNTGCTVSYGKMLTISPYPSVGFVLPEVCINDRNVQFADTSSIADGTQGQFSYAWSFASAGTAPSPTPVTAITKNPTVQFTAAGNYYITDTVTSNKGCRAYLSQPFTVNGSIPQAAFTIAGAPLCSNDSVHLTNLSSVDFGSITKLEIYWDYINKPSQKLTDDTPAINKVYANLYTNFQQPATQNFQVRVFAYSGISCVSVKDTFITITASPMVQFTTLPGICYTASPRQITQATETGNVPGAFSYYGNGPV
ncbi:hypothetical protein F5148DRAFT_1295656 [Russula earlei]|uniref:Uncharacterized protein n=1 Tax=Russula earlei TaxID=71964 RepID=A0ACC0TSX9_9AGAM|nr:hypothetical protein F5148DRAFT_1295656 [Russula earlei]